MCRYWAACSRPARWRRWSPSTSSPAWSGSSLSRSDHLDCLARAFDVRVGTVQAAVHRVDRYVRSAEGAPVFSLLVPVVGRARGDVDPALDAELGRIAAGRLEPATDFVKRRWPATFERSLRKVAVGQLSGAFDRWLGRRADPDRNGSLNGQRVDARGGDGGVNALEGD